jgi:DNA-binding beta-propeller fold protein YncE
MSLQGPVTIPVGDNPIQAEFTPDGTNVYVTLANTGAAVINISSQSVTPIPFAGGGYNLAITPDGNTVYVTNDSTSDVDAIAVNNNNTVTTIPTSAPAGYLYALELDPAGEYLWVCDAVSPGLILTIKTEDNTVINETTTVGDGPVGLAIKGKFGYSANSGSGTVSVFKAK